MTDLDNKNKKDNKGTTETVEEIRPWAIKEMPQIGDGVCGRIFLSIPFNTPLFYLSDPVHQYF